MKNSYNRLHLLALVLFPIAVPALALWVLEKYVYMDRPVIYLEYFLISAVILYSPRLVSIFCLTPLIVMDLFVSMSPGFHFSPDGILDALGGIYALDVVSVLQFAFPVLLGLACLNLVLWLLSRNPGAVSSGKVSVSVVMVTLMVLTYTLDFFWAPNNSRRSEVAATTTNIGGSVLTELYRSYQASSSRSIVSWDNVIDSATSGIFDELAAGSAGTVSHHLMLIVVESLSLFKNPDYNGDLFSVLSQDNTIVGKFDVMTGAVAFRGATVSGELRELCQLEFLGTIPPKGVLPAERCLPQMLRNRGYNTISFNGFYPSFFRTGGWYEELGFERRLFMEELGGTRRNADLCGSTFRAVCDDVVAQRILETKLANSGKKTFFYWLTFNGHLPVWVPPGVHPLYDCRDHVLAADNEAICDLFQVRTLLFFSIRDVIKSSLDIPTTYIIVGDHMAPFLDKNLRGLLDDKKVPFIILTPKAEQQE